MIHYLFSIVLVLVLSYFLFRVKDWIPMIIFGLIIAIALTFWQDPALLIEIRLTIIAIALAMVFIGFMKTLKRKKRKE